MSKNRKEYVKVWEKFNGQKLPKGYEIHHIDGNHRNNLPTNLKAVTIEEHLEIHKKQKDHGAVQAILIRKSRTNEEVELLKQSASEQQKKLIKEGRHNFQINQEKRSQEIKKMMRERKDTHGTYFLGIKDFKENGKKARSKLSRDKELEMMKNWHDKVRGSKWWNNGVVNKRSKNKPGDDFIEGMKK